MECECLECKEVKVLHGRGLCVSCYHKLSRLGKLQSEHDLRVKELCALFKKK